MWRNKIKYLLLFCIPICVLMCNSKSLKNSTQDRQYIEAFSQQWDLPTDAAPVHKSFESEIAFIAALHNGVIKTLQHVEIPHRYFGDLGYYFNNKKGFCYDRAVLIEKMLSHYGFSFRHAYVYFGEDGKMPSHLDLFKKGLKSHALTEVKTKKGWMVLGTNSHWIGLSKMGEPLSLEQIRDSLRSKSLPFKESVSEGRPFWEVLSPNFRYVYGLYSRHGDFFTHQPQSSILSFLPSVTILPDYNLEMLFYNF